MKQGSRVTCTGRRLVVLSMLSFVGIPFFVFHYETHVIEPVKSEAGRVTDIARGIGAGPVTSQDVWNYDWTVFPRERSGTKRKAHQANFPSKQTDHKKKMHSTKLTAGREMKFGKIDRWNRNGSCGELRQRSATGFVELRPGTLLYSAWYDNRKREHFIRVLMMSTTKNLPLMYCHFKGDTDLPTFSREIQYYSHSENHHFKFGTFIGSCPVPQPLRRIPCFIKISTASSSWKQSENNTVVLPVGLIESVKAAGQTSLTYGICVPPLHGQLSVEWLIEFVELSQILGATHLTFYDLAATNSIKQSLRYYERQGLVDVLPWNLPRYIGESNVHYFGQTLAIMDCLYRSMSLFDFVAFNDLDEFIVPLEHDNMISLLRGTLRKTQHCGYCFKSAIFDPWRVGSLGAEEILLTQRVISRTSNPVPLWNKCVVDPRRIFEQGIHHISKQIEEKYTPALADWNKARVFHYRRCQDPNAVWQPRCSAGRELDKTMLKFGERLWRRFEVVKSSLIELDIDL